MTVHKYDDKMRPDHEFEKGDLSYLVEGNNCRLLDGRRTTGYIEKIFPESAMFRWKITKYEDSGKYWDLPFEDIYRFQFELNSKKLDTTRINEIEDIILSFQEQLIISNESLNIKTEVEIEKLKSEVSKWLSNNSIFFSKSQTIDFDSKVGSKLLATDLKEYMKYKSLLSLEIKTAENIVLNPNSGEWIKGMKIVLAEMGLITYKGKITRTKDVFEGIGSKDKRREYILNRLAFIRAYFEELNIDEVTLYRGMSNENNWKKIDRCFLHCTFSQEVANAFSDFSRDSKYKISYLLKTTIPTSQLFMTYIETEEMNTKYKEAEALLLYDKEMSL